MLDISILFELQKIYDDEQSLKRKLKESFDSLVLIKNQFESIFKEKKEASEMLHRLKIKLGDENFKLETEESSIKKLNHELYTTHQSNPKYLRDLEFKIKDLSTIKEGEEELILTLMDDMDNLSKKLTLIHQQEKDIQEALEIKSKAHESLDSLTRDDLFALSINKGALREQLEEDVLEMFDKMMMQCQGKAVALLTQGECSVCRFLIPLSQTEIIKKNRDQIHYCSNCKRIILAL
jgi:predicted  nucleic acid-binding Zn-ribbon protein